MHFLVPDTEYPGTFEISTFYFLAVFVQLTLLLPDTGYPGLLLKSNIPYQKEQFIFRIFYTSHDTNVCKLIFHDVDDFEYAPGITAKTYLSLEMFHDTKTSLQLLICGMFLAGCSEGQLKNRCSNILLSKLL